MRDDIGPCVQTISLARQYDLGSWDGPDVWRKFLSDGVGGSGPDRVLRQTVQDVDQLGRGLTSDLILERGRKGPEIEEAAQNVQLVDNGAVIRTAAICLVIGV